MLRDLSKVQDEFIISRIDLSKDYGEVIAYPELTIEEREAVRRGDFAPTRIPGKNFNSIRIPMNETDYEFEINSHRFGKISISKMVNSLFFKLLFGCWLINLNNRKKRGTLGTYDNNGPIQNIMDSKYQFDFVKDESNGNIFIDIEYKAAGIDKGSQSWA